MGDKKLLYLVESEGFVAETLEALFSRYGYADYVRIVSRPPDMEDCAVFELRPPIRVGDVLDRVAGFLSKSAQGDNLHFGSRYVDVVTGFYYADKDAEPVRLTEKEVALLVLLADAKGEAISRAQILDEVWQYADDVETHTLETHIYRLRQKVEVDPANPEFLKTSDSGYFLSF